MNFELKNMDNNGKEMKSKAKTNITINQLTPSQIVDELNKYINK